MFVVTGENAFGYFQLEPVGRETRALQGALHNVDEAVVDELGRRDVYGHAQFHRPLRCLLTDPAQRPFANLANHADVFGAGDKDFRRNKAPLGMLPADQRLKTGKLVILGLHNGLVVHHQLILVQRVSQILLEEPAQLGALLEVAGIKAVLPSPTALCRV